MKLKVDFSTKEVKPQEEYEIVLNFMEGDADGYKDIHFKFGKERLEEPEFMKELEEFLVCVNECITKDRKGRGGFEDYSELISEYAPGGGYIFATAHNIEPDASPENIVAAFDAAYEYGKYPVSEPSGESYVDFIKGLKLH